MKIGIIGVGFVGGAIKSAFEDKFDVVSYDKFKPALGTFEDVVKADVIFISVPTATDSNWDQVTEPLEEVCGKLKDANYQGLVINKCTVLPGTIDLLAKNYGLRIIHSPEFLTAANANEDFVNQKAVILGGDLDTQAFNDISDIFKAISPNASVQHFSNSKVTEMIKYVHNLFLSVKVSFFNEIYEMCEHLCIPYDLMMLGVHAVGQVGKGHTKVPGPDGSIGYGGFCFPKDTKAFTKFADLEGVDMPVLDAAVRSNIKRRPKEM